MYNNWLDGENWRLLGCLLNESSEYFSENTLFYSTHVYLGRGHVSSPITVWQRNLRSVYSVASVSDHLNRALFYPVSGTGVKSPALSSTRDTTALTQSLSLSSSRLGKTRKSFPRYKDTRSLRASHEMLVVSVLWAAHALMHLQIHMSGLFQWEVRESSPPNEYK